MKKSLVLMSLLAFCLSSRAEVVTDTVTNIVDEIQSTGLYIVNQPEALAKRVENKTVLAAPVAVENSSSTETKDQAIGSSNNTPESVAGAVKTAGYRIQVFSDNNVRTAKVEARSKAQNISARMPHYRTYVTYQAPYWRLRVGDFLTLSEAENAADEMKKIFPAYAREIRVVKDRINRQ